MSPGWSQSHVQVSPHCLHKDFMSGAQNAIHLPTTSSVCLKLCLVTGTSVEGLIPPGRLAFSLYILSCCLPLLGLSPYDNVDVNITSPGLLCWDSLDADSFLYWLCTSFTCRKKTRMGLS